MGNRTVVGYFGLPLLYMVPHDEWRSWVDEFINLLSDKNNFYFANNPLLSEQILWQTGQRVRVLQPLVLYLDISYYPERKDDILVPEPREACILNCLLRAFTPAGYPLNFFSKGDTDRKLKTFSLFR